jgi:hypothetical protein
LAEQREKGSRHGGGTEGVPPLGSSAAGVPPSILLPAVGGGCERREPPTNGANVAGNTGLPPPSAMYSGFPPYQIPAQFAFPPPFQQFDTRFVSDKNLNLNLNSQTSSARSAASTAPRTITFVENSEGHFVPMRVTGDTPHHPIVLGGTPTPTTPGHLLLIDTSTPLSAQSYTSTSAAPAALPSALAAPPASPPLFSPAVPNRRSGAVRVKCLCLPFSLAPASTSFPWRRLPLLS